MIQTGKWLGYYSFSDSRINQIRGFEKTNFEIQILSVEVNKFKGTVQDDLTTGGTEGVGDISGIVLGNKVDFLKMMPVLTLLVNKKGKRITANKKHGPIHYQGEFSADKKTISGTWKIKFGMVWLGIIPIPVRASKGIWTMTLVP